MILEMILTPIFRLLEGILTLLPDFSHLDPLYGHDISGFIYMLAYGFYIFPFALFMTFIGNMLFWMAVQMGWAIIEWAYKKIPGVN